MKLTLYPQGRLGIIQSTKMNIFSKIKLLVIFNVPPQHDIQYMYPVYIIQ